MTEKPTPAGPDQPPLIDRAWAILIGAALCMMCIQVASVMYTFGIFAPEIAASTGWSLVDIAGAAGAGTLVGALLAPLIGLAGDRLGPRRLVILGGPCYAAGLALVGYAPRSAFTLAVCVGIAGALGFAAIPVLYAHIVSGWFAKRRGLALSLLFTATSFGVAFWSTCASALLPRVGWRHSYAIMGATAGLIILAAGVFLIRNPPARSRSANHIESTGLSVAQAVKTGTFWKLIIIFVLVTAILSGCSVPLPNILRRMGASPGVAAAVIPSVAVGMLIGRLSAGILLDRWFAPYVTATFFTFSLAGMVLLLLASGAPAMFAAAVFLAIGIGAEMDAAAYMASRAFGLRSFGTIYGLITLAYGVSGAVGAGATGRAVEVGVAPTTILTLCIALLLIALIVLLTIRPGHFPYAATVD